MFNHWAIGLRSGLLPQDVVLQHQKLAQKRNNCWRSFRKGFDFWCQGMVFLRVFVGSRRSLACFLQGLAPFIPPRGNLPKAKCQGRNEWTDVGAA